MSLTYCAEQVRLHDRDRYLTALFAPDSRRGALFALYGFNLEISRVRETISERLIGEMRLQWWRDALEAIYGGSRPPAHPVAEALAAAIARHALDRALFDRLIDARGRDLDDEPPSDLPMLVDYARETSASLVQLALGILDVTDAGAEKAAEDVGIAYALAGLLRAIPFHASQKRLYLPKTICEETGLDLGRLFKRKSDAALPAAVRPVAAAARSHLARARGHAVPRTALAALLPAVVADAALQRLERASFDPFEPRVARSGIGLPLALAWRVRRSRF